MTERDSDTAVTRRRVLQGAGAAGVAGLAGCLGGGGSNEPMELVHWWTAGGEQDALQALVEGFREEYDYSEDDIENNPAPGGAGSALTTEIQSRVQEGDPPSTFQIWPGQSLTPYTDADLLNDIGDSVWTDDLRNNYRDGVQSLAQFDGTYVAVPLNIHRLNNLFYNVSVLEDAGVDPSSIDGHDALLDALDAVASETDATPMAHQTQFVWSTLQLWENVFLAQQGVDAFEDLLAGNAGSHEDAINDALSAVDEFREYFPSNSGSISWDEGNSDVISGDAAFIHQGDWAAGQYRSADGFEFGDDWDHVPYPGTEGVYVVVTDSFVNPTDNPSPSKTEEFLSYCGSRDAQVRFNTLKGSIPPRTDVDMGEFGPFLTRQFDQFTSSDAQPATIAHGTGVSPGVKTAAEGAFSEFLENFDVEQTTSALVDALGGN